MGNFRRVRQKMVDLEARDKVRNFQPPVTGEEIMARYQIGPCKVVGTIKQAIKDAILDGVIPNERDAALRYMEQIAAREGLVAATANGHEPEPEGL
jgi:tRNA adenylyltransferase